MTLSKLTKIDRTHLELGMPYKFCLTALLSVDFPQGIYGAI